MVRGTCMLSLLLPFFAANSLTLAAIMKYIHINQNKIMDVLNTHILSFRNNLSRVVFASVIVSRTPFRSPCKCETHLTHLVHTRDVPHAINCESLGIHSNYCIINVVLLSRHMNINRFHFISFKVKINFDF